MFTHALAVDENFGNLENAVELKEDSLLPPGTRNGKMFPIPAVTGVKLRREEIGNAERVRQPHGIPFGVVEPYRLRPRVVADLESPFAVDIERLTQLSRSLDFALQCKPKQGQKQAIKVSRNLHGNKPVLCPELPHDIIFNLANCTTGTFFGIFKIFFVRYDTPGT